jgi:acyl-CoA reductase-like NAD-dependent aldehyde dehydrogenase
MFNYTLREPVGVCGQIIPWNGPLAMAAWKIAPALACGNTVILKPAEQTPLTALRLGELLLEAGVPEGVVNIVTGFGETAGAAISAHPDIDKVAFTGSTEVGKLILQASAGNLKRVSLELGGKSPNVIFADADLQKALPASMAAFCAMSGQVCAAGTRIFVEQGFHDEFVDQLAKVTASIKPGDPLAPGTFMGPLVSKDQFDRVKSYLEVGKKEGAKVAIGGDTGSGKGYFVNPTIFTGVKNNMRIAGRKSLVLSPQSSPSRTKTMRSCRATIQPTVLPPPFGPATSAALTRSHARSKPEPYGSIPISSWMWAPHSEVTSSPASAGS